MDKVLLGGCLRPASHVQRGQMKLSGFLLPQLLSSHISPCFGESSDPLELLLGEFGGLLERGKSLEIALPTLVELRCLPFAQDSVICHPVFQGLEWLMIYQGSLEKHNVYAKPNDNESMLVKRLCEVSVCRAS